MRHLRGVVGIGRWTFEVLVCFGLGLLVGYGLGAVQRPIFRPVHEVARPQLVGRLAMSEWPAGSVSRRIV